VLQNYVIGLRPFWNLSAPGISLGILLVGFFIWRLSKRSGRSRIGLVALCDRRRRRPRELRRRRRRAQHQRHESARFRRAQPLRRGHRSGQGVALFQRVSDAQPVELTVGGKTVEALLHRSPDGAFTLLVDGQELRTVG
jgi:hypothetical protein